MFRLDTIGVFVVALIALYQTVGGEEICSTEDNIITYCDGERTYCCHEGTACCYYWFTDMKVLFVGFLILCAGALIIPITCTVCAYCIFNVILKDRTTLRTSEEESPDNTDTKTDPKFPIGCPQQEKYAPEVFISPEEFILDLQSMDGDKKFLIAKT